MNHYPPTYRFLLIYHRFHSDFFRPINVKMLPYRHIDRIDNEISFDPKVRILIIPILRHYWKFSKHFTFILINNTDYYLLNMIVAFDLISHFVALT